MKSKKKFFTKNGTLFFPNSGEDQKKGLHQKWNQARSQKFAMGGLIFESGGGSSSRRRPMGSGGEAHSRRRHGGRGPEPPALENFTFFAKLA